MGFLTGEVRAVTNSFDSLWGSFPPTGLPHVLDVMYLTGYCSILCHIWLTSLGGLLFSEGMQRGCGHGGKRKVRRRDLGVMEGRRNYSQDVTEE